MTQPANDPKQRVIASFNAIAANYDVMRFVQVCAQRLIELSDLPGGARVLDLATGTGLVALAVAQIVGPNGSVVGVDISPGILALAHQKASAAGISNVEFREGDAEHLDLPDASFDRVLCASSLFFVPDMLAALRECHRVLKPDGTLGISSFGGTFMKPLARMWSNRLQQHGIDMPFPPTTRLADPAICQQLFQDAGFIEMRVESEQLGYYLADAEARWQELSASLEGVPLAKFSPAERDQIKAEHLEELAALTTEQGIWVDVPANFTFGRKPLNG